MIHQSPLASYQQNLPYVLAVMELEEGLQMITNVVNCDVYTVHVNTPVTVTFERRGDKKIPQFEPRS